MVPCSCSARPPTPSPHAAPPHPGYPVAHTSAAAARRPVTVMLPCSCTARLPAPSPHAALPHPGYPVAQLGAPPQLVALPHPGYPQAAHPPTLLRVAVAGNRLVTATGRLPWRARQPRAAPIGPGTGQPAPACDTEARAAQTTTRLPCSTCGSKRREIPWGPPLFSTVGRPGRPTAATLLLHPIARAVRWRVFIKQIESMAAYPQQIVTTRLLYCLQDRIEQLSRMQRIYPHAW
jgi:hypothetical protein